MKKYYDEVEGVEIFLYKHDVDAICHPGPNDNDIEDALHQEDVATQFDKYSTQQLRRAVNAVIADNNDCKDFDRERLISYMVWIAAWNIFDDDDYDDEAA